MQNKLLQFDNWKDAIKLIEYEFSRIDKNKHFNTIDMFYYKKYLSKFINKFSSKKAYENFIGSKMIYGIENDLFNFMYRLPKTSYSFRTHSFLSCSARVYHTAIGLYLYKLTNNFLNEYFDSNSRIHSYYGGKIIYKSSSDGNDEIMLAPRYVYYLSTYKSFVKELLKKSNYNNTAEHYMIKIDIKDYYDNINIKTFLMDLYEKISFKDKEENSYTIDTINDICNFYKLIMNRDVGFPQCSNDLAGNFVSSLFMKLVDLEMFESINNIIKGIKCDCKIYQYCDDTYIDLRFDSTDNRIIVNKLLSNIALRVERKFGLKFNTKSNIYFLNNREDLERFNSCIKYTSLSRTIITNENPVDIANRILDQIEKYNSSSDYEINCDEFMLGYIFDDKVTEALRKKNICNRLEIIFQNVNLDKFVIYAKYIVPLCDYSREIRKKIQQYVNDYKDYKLPFCIEYYTKIDRSYSKVFSRNGYEGDFKVIIDYLTKSIHDSKYLGLDLNQIEKMRLYNYNNIINQSILRRISEVSNNYSSALNHLINEVQLIVYYYKNQTKNNKKLKIIDYNAPKVKEDIKDFSPNSIIKVMNAFNRRNNNLISHSVGKEISKEEYNSIKTNIEEFLQEFYSNIFA